jgi:hypothetical protein
MSAKNLLTVDARVRELESLADSNSMIANSVRKLGLRLGLDELATGMSLGRLIKSGSVVVARPSRNGPGRPQPQK